MLGTKKEVKGNSEVSRLEKKYINKIGAGAFTDQMHATGEVSP